MITGIPQLVLLRPYSLQSVLNPLQFNMMHAPNHISIKVGRIDSIMLFSAIIAQRYNYISLDGYPIYI